MKSTSEIYKPVADVKRPAPAEAEVPGRDAFSGTREARHADTQAKTKSRRNPALDFTKGALVLIMVLYHWLNYFYGLQGDVYRYLRFLTPSFIFITGFLVSNIYLSKYGVADPSLPKRLVQRGAKILGVFIALNLARSLLQPGTYLPPMLAAHSSLKGVLAIYVVGSNLGAGADKAIAFSILLPISYLLIFSAGLLFACRVYKYAFHAAAALFLVATLVAGAVGIQSTYLELLTIGLLGVMFGYMPIEKINAWARHPILLAIAYLGYLAAIAIWNVLYPLQVIGVCLSLMILYVLGKPGAEPGAVRSHVVLLGKYSLFGYIAQIAILQLLHRALQHTRLGVIGLGLVLVAATALTVLAVEVTDRLRKRFAPVDKLYKAVFA
jgi:peptidoglycan/LPS O-acetylase OafA/YrhL